MYIRTNKPVIMITTKYIRDNADAIRATLKNRKSEFPLDTLLGLDAEWRKMKTELQQLQSKHNRSSLEISEAKKKGQETKGKISALAELKAKIEALEAKMPDYEERIDALVWNVPNALHKSVPIGDPPGANKTLKTSGSIKRNSGPSHEEILLSLGLLDVERASKTAGSRFYYMRGDLVLLEQSLLRYALDKMSSKGYTPILPPFMLRKKYYRGVAPLAVFEDALYRISEAHEAASAKEGEHMEEDLFLISTSEHALASMHAGELLSGNDLPLKYAGISPSFRREAGSHGKDTKGIFRVHQFDKVEQFVYCKPEDEEKYFDELLANSEEFMGELGIPYRLVLLCSGDTGNQMSKTVDFEGYFPGQKSYRELGSCSTAGAWQSMRLDIKYDENGERKHVYTLNNTAVSAQRTLACLAENYANEDGTITVPEVLVPYMGKSKITK
jgi:seryl-tRNA synthetase